MMDNECAIRLFLNNHRFDLKNLSNFQINMFDSFKFHKFRWQFILIRRFKVDMYERTWIFFIMITLFPLQKILPSDLVKQR
jgi:hypothetical protein